MPNFWSTTTQKIYEVLYGPRTRDTEFDQKVEELHVTIGQIKQVRDTIKNFPSRTSGIQKTCRDLYTHLQACYAENTVYAEFLKDIVEAHKNVECAYSSCAETINALQQMTTDWDKLHAEVQENLQRRESAREVYDHYDSKMEGLVRTRNEKLARHQSESAKDIEKFDRNDGKYKRAANDLIQLSNYTYKLIQDLLDYRYRLLNPMLITFISEEKKFFDACSGFFTKFDNISMKVSALDRGFQKTPITYDPTKHIRATRLLVGVNTNDLPQVTRKDKYSYEDYKNRVKQPSNNPSNNGRENFGGQPSYTYGGSSSTNNMGGGSSSNYSYDSYLKKSNTYASTDLNPPKNNPPSSSTPFSYEAYKAKMNTLSKSSFGSEVPKPSHSNSSNSNPYSSYNNPSKPSSDPFGSNQISQSYIPDSKPINNYDFGFGNSNTNNIPNPYASINFNAPSNPGNDMFPKPSGSNDYMKFSNIGNGQRGGFNNDFPK